MNASADVEPDQPDDACSIPSQLLTVEMLRRPLESTQYSGQVGIAIEQAELVLQGAGYRRSAGGKHEDEGRCCVECRACVTGHFDNRCKLVHAPPPIESARSGNT